MWLILFNSVVIYNVYILICLNFDLSFVKHLQYQSRWVRVYYVLGLLIPFAFTLVPFIMGFYNYENKLGKCTLTTTYEVVNAVNWLKDRITAEDPTRQTENLVYQLKRIVARINLYCWIPFICLLFPIIELIYGQATKRSNPVISLLSSLTINSIGIVHFIIFLLDPALQNAYYSVQTEMLTYYDWLEENKPELNFKQKIQYYLVLLFFVPKSYLIARDYASAKIENVDEDEENQQENQEVGIILDNGIQINVDQYGTDYTDDNDGDDIEYDYDHADHRVFPQRDSRLSPKPEGSTRIHSVYANSFYLTDYDQHLNIL
ncbi:hypothetical protein CONCODRAFT_171140 [Conidiobolus coronatus NRRL 28638]|uniref:Uncharacterized protein n=1 Tax=Conidiobolus coronatus (strain ATCC 28846 / CBS 209.66 / NRRL 28638) TaxID=796925 RepID=A0A137P4S0_CONC2|nr:hypothetical protein CONCODRAFT_171140 [Conidiobolus coronatus NRRL 28638]|eukprot:KXN69996.1 hypothetical protein CONCODRAFT_171140 [Conidiobolus coronatus NRRL 28638]